MHNPVEPTNFSQRLRTLPTGTLPPYNWQEFQRRAQQRSVGGRVATGWRPLAAAAALLLVVCGIAIWGRFGGAGRHVVADSGAVEDAVRTWGHTVGSTTGDGRGRPNESTSNSDGAGAPNTGSGEESGLAAKAADGDSRIRGTGDSRLAGVGEPLATGGESSVAANRARAIETWLASLPRERAVVRVGTHASVAGLEDRIAQVDDLMTTLRVDGMPSDRVAALQRERLRLVGSLAQVRYAEVVASQ